MHSFSSIAVGCIFSFQYSTYIFFKSALINRFLSEVEDLRWLKITSQSMLVIFLIVLTIELILKSKGALPFHHFQLRIFSMSQMFMNNVHLKLLARVLVSWLDELNVGGI